MTYTIFNCTPYDLKLYVDGEPTGVTYKRPISAAWVGRSQTEVAFAGKFPLVEVAFEHILNLPPLEGKHQVIVVPRMVAEAARQQGLTEQATFAVPSGLVYGRNGEVIGCEALEVVL